MVRNIQIGFYAEHFKSSLSPEAARALFQQCVNSVELEAFTHCNRKCWFCPNADMPFRQDKAGNQYMDEQLYLRILRDLASVQYDRQIHFGRYNEPLSDRIILTRIQQAHQHCPQAWLYAHSNGDYLTRDYLEELRVAGLTEICLQTYLGNDDRYDEERMLARQQQQLTKLGLGISRTFISKPNVRHYHLTDYAGFRLTIDARNFDALGTDRGGLVQVNVMKSVRTAPCLLPFTNLYIDWNGCTVPCCNIRSDRPEHQAYVVSKLQDGSSIFDAYVALHAWRKDLLRFSPKGAPCSTCSYDTDSIPSSTAPQLDALYHQLVLNQS